MSWNYVVEEVQQKDKKRLGIRKNRHAWRVFAENNSGYKEPVPLEIHYSTESAGIMAAHWRDLGQEWEIYLQDCRVDDILPTTSGFYKWRKL
jgi:hypothetical protein